jgi:adenylate cyclase
VALAYLGEDIGAIIPLVDRALSLAPSFARGWHASVVIRLIPGAPDMAIEHVENSLLLSPRARVYCGMAMIGAAHFASGRFEEAIRTMHVAIQEDPNYAPPYRNLEAAYANLGRLGEGRETMGRLSPIVPSIGARSQATGDRSARAVHNGSYGW